MQKSLIQTENLSKVFNKNYAVKNLNIDIKEGEFLGLLGPNGSGKTTTVKMLTGILKPSSGNAKFLSKDIFSSREFIKQYIGLAPQENIMFQRKLKVRQYLVLFGRIRGFWGKELKNKIEWLIESLALRKHLNKYVHELSGGLKKRLIIAMSVIHKPKVLFVDEPSLGIDPIGRNGIHQILQELNHNGTTILMTTNYIEEAERLCHRVGILKEGNLLKLASPDYLRKEFHSKKRVEFLGVNLTKSNLEPAVYKEESDIQFISDEKIFVFTNDPIKTIHKITGHSLKNNIKINNIKISEKTLEDVFLGLTKEKR